VRVMQRSLRRRLLSCASRCRAGSPVGAERYRVACFRRRFAATGCSRLCLCVPSWQQGGDRPASRAAAVQVSGGRGNVSVGGTRARRPHRRMRSVCAEPGTSMGGDCAS
jgi:hypothetical protein